MARLYISLLGSYTVKLDGVSLSGFDSDKTRLLLAYLAVEAGKPQRREHLVGLFWPEQPEASARRSLSQAVYNLRQLLDKYTRMEDPFLLSDVITVQLNPSSSFTLDTLEFDRLLQTCQAHDHRYLEACPECLQRLAEAEALYRGDFLCGISLEDSIAFDEWLLMQREHLHRKALEMLKNLAQCYENRGELEKALEVTRRQVELDPLWEAGQRRLMRNLALNGQFNQALAGYEGYKNLLKKELDVSPEKETQALFEKLKQDACSEAPLSRLPAASFPLIGRKEELADLHCYLSDTTCRLITILGPGGSGKTRLVLEEAQRQRYNYRDGIFFIPLSALSPTSSLIVIIAQEVGYTFGKIGDRKIQLLEYLRHKQMLLILDSFETATPNAGLVAEILLASKESKVLVTSRVRLDLSGEQVYPLGGMQVPPGEAAEEVLRYSATELFLEAARRVKPGYQPDNLMEVGRICRLLAGMPLGLMLASTWVSDYTTTAIAEQISRSLDFLAAEWEDLPERQRSLRATFEYSWNLLDLGEQQALMSLSVFRDPFTPQAASQVAGASPQMLRALVGKSLLGNTGEGRYQMHDLVRQYSGEKLASAPGEYKKRVRQEHCDYFLDKVSGWSQLFRGPHQAETLLQADKEINDVQSGWEWAAQAKNYEQLSLSSEGLLLYYDLRFRFQEGDRACQVALDCLQDLPMDGERLNLEGWFLAWQSSNNISLGRIDVARQQRQGGIKRLDLAETLGQDVRMGRAKFLRDSFYNTNSMAQNLDHLLQCAELYRGLGDRWRQVHALLAAGEASQFLLSDPDFTFKLQQEAVRLSREIGEPALLAANLRQLAWSYFLYGPWETGVQVINEAVIYYNIVGDLRSQAMAEVHYASSLTWTGRNTEACTMMEAALRTANRLGYRYLVIVGMLMLGVAQLALTQYDQAYKTLHDAFSMAQQDKLIHLALHNQVWLQVVYLIKNNIAETYDIFEQSVNISRQIVAGAALGAALGLLSMAQHRLGREAQAWSSLHESLRLAAKNHERRCLVILTAATTILLVDNGVYEPVVEAYTAAQNDPIAANSACLQDLIGNRLELVRQHLSQEVYQAAEQRGRASDAFDVFGRLAQMVEAWNTVPADGSLAE